MITTPTIKLFEPFDATKQFIIKFNYSGDVQILKNNVVIEDVLNSEEVYNKEISTFLFQHILKPDNLVNGKSYRVKIRVADIDNNYSQFSTYYIFYTNSLPAISIKNIIDEKVNNQNITFEAIYNQAENVELQSYQYHLYDENKRLIQSYPVKYNKDIDISTSETILRQEITGLKNDTKYYIRVTTRSNKGQFGDSDYVIFSVSYVAPKVNSLLGLDNICIDGAVKVKIIGKRVFLKLYGQNNTVIPDNNIEYVNNEKIDLNRNDYVKLSTDTDFSILKDDYILQVWIENIQENKEIINIRSFYGTFKMVYYDKAFHIFKKYNKSNTTAHFRSNEIDLSKNTDKQFSIWIKSVNGMIDIKVEVM